MTRLRPDTTVTSAAAKVLRAETNDGVAMSFAPLRYRTTVHVEVGTADGLVGYGESWVNYPEWAYRERIATLEDGVFPLLVGEDAADIEAVHASLVRGLEPLGRQWGAVGPIMQAISGVDIALWDLAGKRAGESTAQALGCRVRDTSAVYASSLGPSHVREQAASAASSGFPAMKLKLGFGLEQDIQSIRAVREILPDIALCVDANQAWSLDEAIRMAPVLAQYSVSWLEEPIRGNALEDLEQLHRETGLVIATGENMYGIQQFERYAKSPAVSILQPDVCKVGGLTESRAICAVAHRHGKLVLPHFYGGAVGFAATLQLAAHAPAVTVLEYDVRSNPLRDRTLEQLPRPSKGMIDLPSGVGLGVVLDEQSANEMTMRNMHA